MVMKRQKPIRVQVRPVAAGASASVPPEASRAPVPPPPKTVQAPTFLGLVLEYRKIGDPVPWLEPLERAFLASDPAGTVRDATYTANQFTLLAKELVGVGSEHHETLMPQGFGANFAFDVMHEFGAAPTSVPEFIRDRMLFGTGYSDWNAYPEGLILPQGIQQLLKFRAHDSPAFIEGLNVQVWAFAAWRGYRIWPLGTVQPVQKTYDELARERYRLEPYPRNVTIPVNTDGTDTNAQLSFTEDYVIDGLSIHYPAADGLEQAHWGIDAPFIQFKIEPNATPIMDKYVSLPLVGYNLRRTSWQFDIPLTVNVNTVWNFKVKTRFPAPLWADTLGPIDVVIYGSKLYPGGK